MNTLGTHFRITSFGESHGPGVGCIIDGMPSGIPIDELALQQQVNRRKTAQNNYSSPRQEADQIEILSGIFKGQTTGAPIALWIRNTDARPDEYKPLEDVFRPGHADYTYEVKYQNRDHRGGGRSSIRITAPLVAAGDLARQFLQQICPIRVTAFVSRIGSVYIEQPELLHSLTPDDIDSFDLRFPDINRHEALHQLVTQVHQEGDTLGGNISAFIKGIPAGWGDPVFQKLQAQLAHAMLSINTVKGFEYGDGFQSSQMKGSSFKDELIQQHGQVIATSNHNGGILGGISNGMDIYFRVAFKPISSIRQPQQTIDTDGNAHILTLQGRHDVCAVPRAVPIVEAYTYLVLADAYLRNLKPNI